MLLAPVCVTTLFISSDVLHKVVLDKVINSVHANSGPLLRRSIYYRLNRCDKIGSVY